METRRRPGRAVPRGTWAATVLCLALLLPLAGCSRETELLSGVGESEANEVLAQLSAAGLEARKTAPKEGLVDIVIDSSDVAKAMSLMQAEGLPREHHATLGEVFRKDGLISSPLEERARYVWALSEELASTINLMDGVVKARVHVVLPERSDGGETTQAAAAAVFIKLRQGYSLQSAVPQIRQLVSNSIPGLEADHVSIVLVTAQRVSSGDAAASVPAASSTSAASGPQTVESAEANGAHGSRRPLLVAAAFALIAGLAALAWVLRARLAVAVAPWLARVRPGAGDSRAAGAAASGDAA